MDPEWLRHFQQWMADHFGLTTTRPDGTKAVQSTTPPGQLVPGNIDPIVGRAWEHNPDGGYSTTLSTSYGTDAGETLVPRVVGGQRLTDQQALDRYRTTGQQLGIFDTPAHADAYANWLHRFQTQYENGAAADATAVNPIRRAMSEPTIEDRGGIRKPAILSRIGQAVHNMNQRISRYASNPMSSLSPLAAFLGAVEFVPESSIPLAGGGEAEVAFSLRDVTPTEEKVLAHGRGELYNSGKAFHVNSLFRAGDRTGTAVNPAMDTNTLGHRKMIEALTSLVEHYPDLERITSTSRLSGVRGNTVLPDLVDQYGVLSPEIDKAMRVDITISKRIKRLAEIARRYHTGGEKP